MDLSLATASVFLANSLASSFAASTSSDGGADYFGIVEITKSFTLVESTCAECVGIPNGGTGSAKLWISGVAKLRGTAVSIGESSGQLLHLHVQNLSRSPLLPTLEALYPSG